MRITRVALSFFSVGFLAGTFEQAAGLGDPQRGQRASIVVSEATLAPSIEPVAATASPPIGGEPMAPARIEPDREVLPQHAPTRHSPLDMGDASAAEAVVAAFASVAGPHPVDGEATTSRGSAELPALVRGPTFVSRQQMSGPEAAAPSPRLRPFFAPLPLEEGPLVVPEPQIAERPREFIMPFEKGRVTSMFNQGRRHPAIDLAGPLGTPVYATTRKQRVTFAGRRGGYGNLVITRDPLGRQHYYGHLHRIVARAGTLLDQGETLGLLGSTGHSTGPHVHYEVRTRAGRHLDPSTLLFADRRVSRGYAWNTPRPASTRLAARSGQPRPR